MNYIPALYNLVKPLKAEDTDICMLYLKYMEKQMIRTKLNWFSATRNSKCLEDLPTKGCKRRLFVGEGDFSYTESLLKKHKESHPKLAQSITATILAKKEGLSSEIQSRIEKLTKDFGVEILSSVDASKLSQFNGRIKRIHWNCPYKSTQAITDQEYRSTIKNFFQECSKVQESGDRIHVALLQSDYYTKELQTKFALVEASAEAKYRLIKKRVFGDKRYEGYVHVKYNQQPHEATHGALPREFVFEKTGEKDGSTAEKLMDPGKKYYTVNEGTYFTCSTDEDSSDYYESD